MNVDLPPDGTVRSSWPALLRKPFSVVRLGLSNCLAALLHKLAVKWFNNLQFVHAHTAYKLILQVKPDDRLATLRLVELYMEQVKEDEAMEVLSDWLKRFPDDVDVLELMCRLYIQMEEPAKAKEHLDRAARLAPNSPGVLVGFGLFHRGNGELDESSAFFRLALKQGENSAILCSLADNLLDQGEQAEAVSLIERAVQIAPDQPFSYSMLARFGYYRDASHPHIDFLKKQLKKSNLSPTTRLRFHFTLGRVFESLSRWDEAFGHFQIGNDLNRRKFEFDIEEVTSYVDQETLTFDHDFLNAHRGLAGAPSGDSLIFVLGMPRSGTTLVEQVLASHPAVRAGGERRDVQKIAKQLCLHFEQAYPQCVCRLDCEGIADWARTYLARVSSFARGLPRFVDKQPINFLKIGLIATLFPGAKIVHCRRNSMDTCVSSYCRDFLHVPYSHDLKTLGLFYRQYERIMAHWHSVLPGRILDIQYESLVTEPEAHIRRLLAYCELPWHEGCLSPHQTKRVVQTASAAQVKLPIYTRSVGRWRNYEKHLKPLLDVLGPAPAE